MPTFKPGLARTGKAGLGPSRPGFTVAKKKPNLKPYQAKPKPNKAKPGLADAPQKTQKAAPTAPTAQPATPDALYYSNVDLADRKGTQRLGDLDTQERGIKHDFGIDDPTNPRSRANALKNAFLARQKAASAGLATQGQLYSGAHERALDRTRREEEQARAELRQAYDAAIGEIGTARAGVKFDTEEGRQQAFEDWLARAPEADEPLTEEEIAAPDVAQAAAPAVLSPVAAPPAQTPSVGEAGGFKGGPTVGTAQQLGVGLGGLGSAEQRRAAARAAKKRDRLLAAKTERKQQYAKSAPSQVSAGIPGGQPSKVKVAPKPKPKAKGKGKGRG